MALLNDATNSAQQGIIPSGVPVGGAYEQKAFSELEKSKGSIGSTAQNALMGAAMGGKAAEGALNPLSAFIQGAAVGMGVPAEMYAKRQAQLKSTIDATPFGIVHKEMIDQDPRYQIFAGLPNAIVMEMIKTIGPDAIKIDNQAKADKDKMKYELQLKEGIGGEVDFGSQVEEANKIKALPTVASFYSIAPSYKNIMSARGAGGDKTLVIKFGQMLNPTIRVNEGTMETLDTSSTMGKFTHDMWAKAMKGELSPDDRNNIRAAATDLYNNAKIDFERTAAPIRVQAAKKGYDLDILLPDSNTPEEIKQILDPVTNTYFYGKRAIGPDGSTGWIKVK